MWIDPLIPSSGPLTRRAMLSRLAGGMGLVGLAGLLHPVQLLGADGSPGGPHHRPRARRVIFLFMNGGPSHVDTFDPKPELRRREGEQPNGELYRKNKGAGFMPSPLQFSRCGQSGIEISESLPHLASVIDDCCIIRSMRTDVPNHEPALLQMHTGNIQPVRPSLGSWLLYGLGTENRDLPGYVVLRPTPKIVVGPALWSNSFLPAAHQATSVITADMRVDRLIANIHNPRLTEDEQREQVEVLGQLNRIHLARREGDEELEGQIRAMETAFRMQREAAVTFDIEREPESVRRAYGSSPFARSCLLARRLVEAGVRFVTVYYVNQGNQPWDTHSDHDATHRKLCADADRPTAALIADLKARGLLDDTLVVWGGEFGRTPYAENRKDQKVGRDHHHTAFSMLLAGGGVRGGMVYGSSDELGMNAVDRPVHVHDLHATILHLLGLNHERLTYRYAGRDFRLTDVSGHVVSDIFA
ncbi:MAG TPA: DUF1501 domain-containing protein [Candidatus Saccharimonadales bacterium]|nr:DUF1501 domain-containing protein [Candidatus Saccharimonadales bacterium]